MTMRRPSRLIYTDSNAINIETWLYHIGLERQNSHQELLREACLLAKYAGEDSITPNGESCLHQGLAMAEILADLNLDDDTLAAAIVYSCVQNADLKVDDVTEHLGSMVAKLIEGTHQMDAVHSLQGKLAQRRHLDSTVDNLRKMLLAIVDDVRVVLIKFAERLCILRNLLTFTEKEIAKVATETLEIYAPLANRLGIGHLKWQLEDLSFRYLEPEEYLALSRGLKDRREDRDRYVNDFISVLESHLIEAVSTFKVTGRAKHIYSIYKKMQRKQLSLEEIYDAIAFRILVPTLDDCYLVLSIVHSLWKNIPKEFDDYITQPKPNGYRSIHTAVEGPEGKHVEIQIRTFDMHQEAELGVAAHWMYKEGAAKGAGYEQKIAWLRQVMDWQKEVAEAQTGDPELFTHIFHDRAYIFTPNGDVIDLPRGASPLDYAYQIHSELGHRCRGAKVNGSIVPLTYALRSGDMVEILTAKQGHPSRDWLNPHLGYLKTSRAKAKVAAWFRKQDYDRNLIDGHDLLEKELKRHGIRELPLEELASRLHYKSKEEMFVSLGRGDLRIHNVLLAVHHMTAGTSREKQLPTLPETIREKAEPPAEISIEGVGNLLTYLAKCCKPVPGDSIVGYVTLGRGISIHRDDCQNFQERASLYPDRRIKVAWGNNTAHRYPVDLNIIAYDRNSLLQDLTALLANEQIPIISVNAAPNKKTNTTTLHVTVEVGSIHPLSRILARISQLQGIMSVQRE